MSLAIYVVDTSYLIELAACGRDSHPKACERVRERFKQVAKSGGRFFVPLPCLFELGDHIADVKHDKKRKELAEWLRQTVLDSLDKRRPWEITPTGKPEEILPLLMERFQDSAVKKRMGLVDTFTVQEAERLKERLSKLKARVHIWTNDQPLKACEPDEEEDPYLWKSDGSSIFE